jgi:hypothetical protein
MSNDYKDGFHEDFELSGEKRDPKPEHPGIDRARWGLFSDPDIASYHAGVIGTLTAEDISLSQSGMKKLLKETPLDFAFNNRQLNPDAEKLAESVAMRRGDVVHQLALGKGEGYAVLDFADWRTKDAKAARDRAIADGLTPIKRADFEEAEVMADVLREKIRVALDGADYETEVAFVYQEMTRAGPIWVRGLMDVWCADLRVILDPKVTPQLHPGTVERHFLNMGWDLQAALYPHAVGQILGGPDDGRVKFANLLVSPNEPFISRTVKLPKDWFYSSVKQCELAMERFGACLYAGEWPSYEGIETLELPGWEAKRREAEEIGGAN